MFVEDYEQHKVRVALYLFQNDYVKARELLIQLMEQTFQPSTPTYNNSGQANRGELSSCYLFVVDDSIESLNFVEDSVANASSNGDRKSTRLNSSHVSISYAVFCLKKRQ